MDTITIEVLSDFTYLTAPRYYLIWNHTEQVLDCYWRLPTEKSRHKKHYQELPWFDPGPYLATPEVLLNKVKLYLNIG